MSKQCPNECGELENTRGHIETNDGRTYFKVDILYCPDCLYVIDTDVSL